MANVYDYLEWRGDISFRADGYNEIDALIISQLTYVPFDGIVSKNGRMNLAQAAAVYARKHPPADKKEEGNPMVARAEQMLRTVAGTPRYESVAVSGYVKETSTEDETQFCAMVFSLPGGYDVVAYRGTDGTVVGWNENFNLGFMEVTYGQQKAVAYLNEAAKKRKSKLFVTGHSKGGNLAMYAASFCEREVRDRIEAVYNLDGPGFLAGVIESEEYRQMLPKIKTFIPKTSIVGRLLEHSESVTVVESTEKRLDQHDQTTWQLVGRHFITLPDTDSMSHFVEGMIKNWMETMTKEQLNSFVDILFEVLQDMEIETIEALQQIGISGWRKLYKRGSELSKGNSDILKTAFKGLLSQGGKQFVGMFKDDEEGEAEKEDPNLQQDG